MILKKPNLVLSIGDNAPRTSYALFPVAFYLANLYRMTDNSSLPYLLCIYLFGAIGIINFLISRKYVKPFVFFLLVYFIGGLFNYAFIGNIELSDIAADAFFFGIAYIMLKNPCTYKQGILSFYITCFAFLLFYFSSTNTRYILTSSSNYISVLLIIAASLYYIALQQNKQYIAIWDIVPSFLCFFLSVWARGRSGIISTGLLSVLILLLFTREITNKNKKRLVGVIALLLIAGVVLLSTETSISAWFFSLGKLEYRGVDNSARQQIWGSYLNEIKGSVVYFIFGAPLKDIIYIAVHGGNCHNSFIQLHAYNGLLPFVTFLVFLVKSFIYYIRKNNLIIAVIMLVFCIRAFTDKFIFGQYGMPLMIYFIMKPYFDESTQVNNNLVEPNK